VWFSVRHGPSILPSRVFGFPLHRLASLFAIFPRWLLDPAVSIIPRLFFGDLRRLGLRRHSVGGGTRLLEHGVVFALDDGFVAALKSGRFEADGETVGFEPNPVELSNGRRIDPEVVICATGYRPGLEEMYAHLGALDEHGYPLHPMGQADAKKSGPLVRRLRRDPPGLFPCRKNKRRSYRDPNFGAGNPAWQGKISAAHSW
jgi:hypothetical protein